ncbi:RNA polymerase II elongation factor ELL-like [Engraulis encrasicolus]|uniref:RNA polymerase II elongation factor ELL-like n=1 Tax=Engraulis encrasicolus TaxID=184585 RepID=UPI002FD48915
MATLKEEQSYGLSCGRLSNGKNTSIFHVKLTDSALRAIENYQSSKGSTLQPSIQFTGSQGRIRIPRNRATAEEGCLAFSFYLSHVGRDGPQGSFDCIQQYTACDGAVELDCLGVIQDKITVNATDDSYQKARQNMAQVEKETRQRGAIVIKQGGRCISKRVQIRKPGRGGSGLPGVMTPTWRSHLSRQAAASPPVRTGTGRPKQVGNDAAAAVAAMPIRARLVHLLVLKPYRRAELVLRLERDGLAPDDKDAIDNLLAQVANQNERNRSFSLKEEVLGEVNRSWPGYTVGDQQLLKRILLTKARKLGQSQNLLSSPATVELTRSPQREQANSSPSQRRPAPEYIDPVANKKPRISHLASRGDNQVNGALAQERAASPAPTVTMASEPRLPRLEIPHPSDPLDVRPDSGANGRDCEGSNTSAPSDRLGQTSCVSTTTRQSLPVLPPSIQPADASSAASSHKSKSHKKTKKHKDKEREGGRAKDKSRRRSKDVDGTTPEDVNTADALTRVTDLNGSYEHQTLTTTASDPEEYLKTYTRIVSQEQRQKYKSDFNVEYNEYRKLHAHIEAVTRHFTILHGQIKELQKDSDQYQTIRNQIFQEYRQIKKDNPNYSQDKSRCEYLHRKLAHIKKTIGEYDHKQL